MSNTIWMNKTTGSTWLLTGWNSNQGTLSFEGGDLDMKLRVRKGANMFDALEHEYSFIGSLY